jgi:hypothetical protein
MCRNWSPESMDTEKVPYMRSFKRLKLRRKDYKKKGKETKLLKEKEYR